MATAPTLSCAELILLFGGDEDSRGCPSAGLVEAICAQLEPAPANTYTVAKRIYGFTGSTPEWLAFTYEQEAIEQGFAAWRAKRKEEAQS